MLIHTYHKLYTNLFTLNKPIASFSAIWIKVTPFLNKNTDHHRTNPIYKLYLDSLCYLEKNMSETPLPRTGQKYLFTFDPKPT